MNVAHLVVVRGRRRIGKSRLAEKFGESFDYHYTFVGLPPEKGVTEEIQRHHFANELEIFLGKNRNLNFLARTAPILSIDCEVEKTNKLLDL